MKPESYVLVGRSGEVKGRDFALAAGTSIGRATSAEISLSDPLVAPVHCRVNVSPAGYLWIYASKGCFVTVNGVDRRSKQLELGDMIGIGPYLFEIRRSKVIAPPVRRSRLSRTSLAGAAERGVKQVDGIILAARVVTQGDPLSLPELLRRLLHLGGLGARREKGRWLASNPWEPIVWWGKPATARNVARMALRLQSAAYLTQSAKASLRLKIGVARGSFWTGPLDQRHHLAWGEAVESASRLARQAADETTLFDEAVDPREPLLGSSIDLANTSALRLAGCARATPNGEQASLMIPIYLRMGSHWLTARLIQASRNQQGRTGLTILTMTPMTGKELGLEVAPGAFASFLCKARGVLPSTAIYRYRLAGKLPSDSFDELINGRRGTVWPSIHEDISYSRAA